MRSKYTAAIFALLLGGIGIHRYYLGNYFMGVVYTIFCFTFIPLLISLIEFLYFLCVSQKEFDIKYNADYIMKKDYISKMS